MGDEINLSSECSYRFLQMRYPAFQILKQLRRGFQVLGCPTMIIRASNCKRDLRTEKSKFVLKQPNRPQGRWHARARLFLEKLFMEKAQIYHAIPMAKITGEPGKISLKFCSGKGIEEFQQKFSLTNSEIASFLRDLAQEIESGGKVEVAYGSVSLSVNPAPPIKLEVELEDDELEIEIKLKDWH
ncbi:MAG: hypothetical protein A4E49_02834 [Methanosaeta sp. PtaU1.Bin112]|nr:MAG: hypothetical protein A4E49_02834 [Methanosaeta sp. PtaU1.Bin112]